MCVQVKTLRSPKFDMARLLDLHADSTGAAAASEPKPSAAVEELGEPMEWGDMEEDE